MSVQELIDAGRMAMTLRTAEERRMKDNVESAEARARNAIHEAVVEFVGPIVGELLEPIGVMYYKSLMGFDRAYWAEVIEAPGMLPVILRFDVRGWDGAFGRSGVLLLVDVEDVNVGYYRGPSFPTFAIARPIEDDEEPKGWRWDYVHASGVDDYLDVVLAMAVDQYEDAMRAVDPLTRTYEIATDVVESVSNLSKYENYERFFIDCRIWGLPVVPTQNDILSMIGQVLSDIAMSQAVIAQAAIESRHYE